MALAIYRKYVFIINRIIGELSMNKDETIQAVASEVRRRLEGAEAGHDWWHIHCVRQIAKTIATEEGADLFVVELSALLHDISDYKFNGGDEDAGARIAREILFAHGVSEEVILHVEDIINSVSFKGAGVADEVKTLEGKCVQDADRLEALGARGIARAFTYGGHADREMYNPDIAPLVHVTKEEYKAAKGTTVNHFYEKLLLLKGRMKTNAGKRLAEGRHKYMEEFLAQFFAEWNGER